ncbi:MAG: nucleotidyl transferase AbiEii/AbiGii toxin family protein [Blastocatellia bacterium]
MNFHPRILTAKQQKVLTKLGGLAKVEGYYLAGGTALALQIGHRRSVDFDFFTQQNLDDPLLLASRIQAAGAPLETGSVSPGTLFGTISSVKVSFIAYRYPMLNDLVVWPQYDLLLAALPDLAAMKLAAITQRGAKKDFIDIAALMSESFTLEQMLQMYQTKYGIGNIMHLLYSLVYFDDADQEKMPVMISRITWPKIKKLISAQVNAYVNQS